MIDVEKKAVENKSKHDRRRVVQEAGAYSAPAYSSALSRMCLRSEAAWGRRVGLCVVSEAVRLETWESAFR
jgi:hypothetical protein